MLEFNNFLTGYSNTGFYFFLSYLIYVPFVIFITLNLLKNKINAYLDTYLVFKLSFVSFFISNFLSFILIHKFIIIQYELLATLISICLLAYFIFSNSFDRKLLKHILFSTISVLAATLSYFILKIIFIFLVYNDNDSLKHLISYGFPTIN